MFVVVVVVIVLVLVLVLVVLIVLVLVRVVSPNLVFKCPVRFFWLTYSLSGACIFCSLCWSVNKDVIND